MTRHRRVTQCSMDLMNLPSQHFMGEVYTQVNIGSPKQILARLKYSNVAIEAISEVILAY